MTSTILKYSKTLLISTFVLSTMSFLNCSEKKSETGFIIKDNLIYKSGEDKPFTGTERARVEDKIIEYDIVNGIKHGKFRIYFEDETLSASGQIDSNKNTGKWQYFYKSGNLESEGFFENDLPNGKWIWFYESGGIREKGSYDSGKRVGIWKQYSEKGELISEEEFNNVDSTSYFQDSQLKLND